jgi:hypothetical protein
MWWRRALLVLVAVAAQACSPISSSPAGPSFTVPGDTAFLDHVEWKRLGAKDLPSLPALRLVVAGGRGLIGTGDEAFWRSDDGSTWQQIAGAGPPDAAWRRLISAPDGTVIAVGSDLGSPLVPVISRISVDGIDNLNITGPRDMVGDATEFGGHLIAVGGDEAGHGLVWTSPDGLTWSRVPLSAVPLLAVVAGGRSSIVAGEDLSAPELGNGRLGFWRSADGINWVSGSTFSDAGASDMVALQAGFVAVGDALAPGQAHVLVPAAWFSQDGAKWIPMTTPAAIGLLNAVTTWRGVPIAVGWTLSNPQQGVVLASRDGLAWEALAGVPLDASRLYDITVTNDRLVIVGIEAGPTTDPVVLIGNPPR